MAFSTKSHRNFWSRRKINWKHSYLDGVDEATNRPVWNHPHRELLVMALKSFHWMSLWEVGCGAGANLVKITKEIPGRQLGGSDVNPDAITSCEKTFNGAKFHVESVEDMLLSDKAVDVMLADAALIYIGPGKIKQAVHEMVRCTRNVVILCEFYDKRWWKRWWFRLRTGYNAHDYKKLLENEGCYDVQIIKIPPAYWPGFPWDVWGHIVVAKVV